MARAVVEVARGGGCCSSGGREAVAYLELLRADSAGDGGELKAGDKRAGEGVAEVG
jgi:hypothetical protein